MSKGARKGNGGFELSEAPSHLIRRCQQFYGDLYARESGARELTKQQYTLLAALEHNDGASQTVLVEITGIDRSTLAEMVRRMLEKGLLSRERTEEDGSGGTGTVGSAADTGTAEIRPRPGPDRTGWRKLRGQWRIAAAKTRQAQQARLIKL